MFNSFSALRCQCNSVLFLKTHTFHIPSHTPKLFKPFSAFLFLYHIFEKKSFHVTVVLDNVTHKHIQTKVIVLKDIKFTISMPFLYNLCTSRAFCMFLKHAYTWSNNMNKEKKMRSIKNKI